jgi:FMN phosphatase YigB (HAD superfamily)
MPAIDAVVFDFGNVLGFVDKLACTAAMARHCEMTPEAVERAIWGTDIERLSETGAWDEREHFRRVRDAIGGRADWGFEQFREEFVAGFSLNPEGLEAMRLARSLGKRVFVLSNTSFTHARWLFANEELVRLAEDCIFSFKVGVMKPDPAIWRHLLSSHCLEARRCVYIDDVAAYCTAAEELGFSAIRYVRGKTDLVGSLRSLLRD